MTRRKAAGLAALVALFLAATYLLTRRGGRRGEPVATVAPTPAARPTASTPAPAALSPVAVPAAAVDEPTPGKAAAKPEPRSWGPSRAVPARTPAAPTPTPTAEPLFEPVEQPLPTWLRVGIVVAALLAFFAVSLIATKQV